MVEACEAFTRGGPEQCAESWERERKQVKTTNTGGLLVAGDQSKFY